MRKRPSCDSITLSSEQVGWEHNVSAVLKPNIHMSTDLKSGNVKKTLQLKFTL